MKRRPDFQTTVEDNGKPAQSVFVSSLPAVIMQVKTILVLAAAIPHQDGVILPSAAAAGKNETHWIQLV